MGQVVWPQILWSSSSNFTIVGRAAVIRLRTNLIDRQRTCLGQRDRYLHLALIQGFGRPPIRPRARAAANPDIVRSRIRFRSYPAIAPITENTIFPNAVDVSKPSWTLAKCAHLCLKSSKILNRWLNERPKRSSFQNHKHIFFADVIERFIQSWTLSLCTTHPVIGIFSRHRPLSKHPFAGLNSGQRSKLWHILSSMTQNP